MRKEYKLTQKQLDTLIEASRPVPYMIFGGMEPPSPQENANHAWERLGKEMGFDPYSVKPVPDKSVTYFTADVTETKEDV